MPRREGLPDGGTTSFVYEGCDPATGESTPNEFVVPFLIARFVAYDFLLRGTMSEAVSWFEVQGRTA